MTTSSKRTLYLDIETYCEEDLKSCGVYKYAAASSLELLLLSYCFDDEPVQCLDLNDDRAVGQFGSWLVDQNIVKVAHNALFEQVCLSRLLPTALVPHQWVDTMALANYAALPASLSALTDVLRLGDQGKLSIGTQLINYFCKPCKPTKANGGRTRNLPEQDAERWEAFVDYNKRDVEALREVYKKLINLNQGGEEPFVRRLDWSINRRGIRIDLPLVERAVALSQQLTEAATEELKGLTGLSNPNSTPQFKQYLSSKGLTVDSFTKTDAEDLLTTTDDPEVLRAIELKLSISKASVKKYDAMLRAVCPDGTVKGAFQYYGASRTGRWAGRLVQLQNLKRNSLPELDIARQLVLDGDLEGLQLGWDNYDPSEILGQLVRTALIPSEGRKFIVADFAAIEARVIAWLAREKWRQDVFAVDGDIYKSSYAQAFACEVGDVTKDMRQKGKIMELALGYGGSVGALKAFGADKLGLNDEELKQLVTRWRRTSPRIVRFWQALESAAKSAVDDGKVTKLSCGVSLSRQGKVLIITLPSGRNLVYQDVKVQDGRFGPCVTYMDVNQTSRQWTRTETHGGKLAENVTQAVARDCLAYAMLRLSAEGYDIVAHVHDEVIIDAPLEATRDDVARVMGCGAPWAQGLHLSASSYEGRYYFKD